MLLTKKYLKELLNNMRISIPKNLEKDLLKRFGETCVDDEGYIRDFTAQDIHENVRKAVFDYENNKKITGEVKNLKIQLNKEYLDDLCLCVEKNTVFISSAVNIYLKSETTDIKLIESIDNRLHEIVYLLNRAYNRELIDLKNQARSYYKNWLILKNKDKTTANAVYIEYMILKHKIDSIERSY
jgi:hypothetical protein